MLIQISSGIGAPVECERAVYLFSQELKILRRRQF